MLVQSGNLKGNAIPTPEKMEKGANLLIKQFARGRVNVIALDTVALQCLSLEVVAISYWSVSSLMPEEVAAC